VAAEAAVASEQAPEADNIIVARDVHKWFGDFHALRGVTTSVRRSEVVVVIGPSGSGKSTFIRAINRLEQHQRGDIIVDGVEMTDDVRNIDAIRREVGMVFQSFNLFPHLTVLRNITLAPTKVRKTPLADAENSARELLERVGIPEQADKYPGELSGGQQQRVGIARALVKDPAILLADEPTGNLDTASSREIMWIIQELNRQSGITVVIVTHERDIAAQAARVVTMLDGKVLDDTRQEPVLVPQPGLT
jgi:general L-amino acid transport system ATP-binding protein